MAKFTKVEGPFNGRWHVEARKTENIPWIEVAMIRGEALAKEYADELENDDDKRNEVIDEEED